MGEPGGLFDGAEVISAYGADEGVEDGFLTRLSPRDYITSDASRMLEERLPVRQPPNRWPVNLMGWMACSDSDEEGDRIGRVFAAAMPLIEALRSRVTMESTPLTRWAILGPDDRIGRLAEEADPTAAGSLELLFGLNEQGGVTFMLPSDN